MLQKIILKYKTNLQKNWNLLIKLYQRYKVVSLLEIILNHKLIFKQKIILKYKIIYSHQKFYKYIYIQNRKKLLHSFYETWEYYRYLNKKKYGISYSSERQGYCFFIWGKTLDLTYINIKRKLLFVPIWCIEQIEANIWIIQIFYNFIWKCNFIVLFFFKFYTNFLYNISKIFFQYVNIFSFKHNKFFYITSILLNSSESYFNNNFDPYYEEEICLYFKHFLKQTYNWNFEKSSIFNILNYEDDFFYDFRELVYQFKMIFRYFYSGDSSIFFNYLFLRLSNNLLEWDTLIFYKYDFLLNKQLIKIDIPKDDDEDEIEQDEEDFFHW